MKVLRVEPGTVFKMGDLWTFTIMLDGLPYADTGMGHPTANAAKQAMREKVRFERKRHGLG